MSMHVTPTTPHSRLMGVFAHPDDEVFCAGGILARWIASGGEALVVSATRGEAGQIQDGDVATRRTLGVVREWELRSACARLGVQRVACLDYRDGALQEGDEEILARDVATCINEFNPDVVVTFGQDGGTGHPDHVAISAATTRACQRIASAGGHAPHLYYAAFPRQHHLLCRQVARWLVRRAAPFSGSEMFAHALALLAEEATLLGYADDTVETRWFPAGVSLVEQGEPGTSLYLIIAGHAGVIQEDAAGIRRALRRVGPGQFFGAEALARRQPHDASLVAIESVTCLTLSTRAPTPFDGRGEEPRLGGGSTPPDDESCELGALTRIDVAAWLGHKIAALSAHRTQFALEPAAFPSALLAQWLGAEYFVSAALTDKSRDPRTRCSRARSGCAAGPDDARVGQLWESSENPGREGGDALKRKSCHTRAMPWSPRVTMTCVDAISTRRAQLGLFIRSRACGRNERPQDCPIYITWETLT